MIVLIYSHIFAGALLCIAVFGWFVAGKCRQRVGGHWFGVTLRYGLPLIATWVMVGGTCAFCAGINLISHRHINFDTQSMVQGAAIGTLIFVIVCLGQLAVIAVLSRFTRRYGVHLDVMLLPVLLGALLLCGWCAHAALPKQRFTQFIGAAPPASVHEIQYERYTAGFYTSVRLTCRVNPEDAEILLQQNRKTCEITYNPTNNVLTARYAAD